jgi:SAM-dependent methyltransferase
MLPSLLQDLIMVPMHAVDGLSVRYGFFRTLYRAIAPFYGRSRASQYFGQDLFLSAIHPGHSVLELGSGTGFLTRRVGKKAGKCVGLELEQAMVDKAKVCGGENGRHPVRIRIL